MPTSNRKSSLSRIETISCMRGELLTSVRPIAFTHSTTKASRTRRTRLRLRKTRQLPRTHQKTRRRMSTAQLATMAATPLATALITLPAPTSPSLTHSGRRMRRCSSSTLSSMWRTSETRSLRTSATKTGRPLQTWSRVAPPSNVRSAGSSFRTLRGRNRRGPLARPRF